MLNVDARALVPRPETEVVVERCLAHLEGIAEPRILDVGTGSGAIALSLADEVPHARVVAVDLSEDALALARENLARADVDGRVELRRGDLLTGVAGPFDLVVSNPPYVPAAEYDSLQPEIRLYEPYGAVVGDRVWEQVAREARGALAPGGWLVLECGDGQAAEVSAGLDRARLRGRPGHARPGRPRPRRRSAPSLAATSGVRPRTWPQRTWLWVVIRAFRGLEPSNCPRMEICGNTMIGWTCRLRTRPGSDPGRGRRGQA